MTIREPIFKEAVPPVWIVPIFTNVAPPLEVGEITVDADTGKILSTDKDVVEMIQKGYTSFGVETFAVDKQECLAELLALNGEKPLESEAKQEMETSLLKNKQGVCAGYPLRENIEYN